MPLPIFAALVKAAPYVATAFSVYAQSRQKPKKEDYTPTGSMYNRWVNYLKGKTAESTVYQQRMRPALRQIGQQTQRGQRQVGYQVARDKPGGGVEAQMRMGINRQALEAIGIASEKASVAQEQVNVRTGEQLLRIGVQEEELLRRYESDKRRFTQQMFRTVAYAGINLADTAVRQSIANTRIKIAAAKDVKEATDIFNTSLEKLKADKLIPQDTSPEQLQEIMDTGEYQDPGMLHRYLTNVRAQQGKDIKFQESERKEALVASSTQAATQAYKLIADRPEGALEMLEETGYFRYMTDKDILAVTKKAITEAPTPIDPLTRKIAITRTTTDITAAEKNLTEAVERGTVKQITDAGNVIDTINSRKIAEEGRKYTQETRQTAADKKVRDAKVLEYTLTSDLDSTIAYLGIAHKEFSIDVAEPQIGKVGETVEPLKKSLEKIELNRVFKKLTQTFGGITFKDGKGMTLADARGLKRLAIRYVSLIDIDSLEEKNALKVAVFDFDEKEVRRISRTFTGLDAKRAATFTLEIIKRIDSLFNKMPSDSYGEILDALY